MDPDATDLADLRRSIDSVDEEIVRLLVAREALVRRVGALKKDATAVRAPGRAREVVERAGRLAEEAGGTAGIAERIYQSIVDTFIDMELADLQRRTSQ